MQFIGDLVRNLVFLVGIGIFLYLLSPSFMGSVFQIYGQLFGPLVILLLIAAALPRRRRRR